MTYYDAIRLFCGTECSVCKEMVEVDFNHNNLFQTFLGLVPDHGAQKECCFQFYKALNTQVLLYLNGVISESDLNNEIRKYRGDR